MAERWYNNEQSVGAIYAREDEHFEAKEKEVKKDFLNQEKALFRKKYFFGYIVRAE